MFSSSRLAFTAESFWPAHESDAEGTDTLWRLWLGRFLPRSNLLLIAQGRRPGHSWASPEGDKMDTKSKYDKPTKPTDFDLETAIFGAP